MNTIKSHCNKCQLETNHDVLHSESVKWEEADEDDNYPPINGTDIYQMLKCRGCDAISFKYVEWFEGNFDEKGNEVPEIHYYPSAIYRSRLSASRIALSCGKSAVMKSRHARRACAA